MLTKLLRVELRLPGQWRDVWLYKEKLYFWTRDGALWCVEMERVRRHLQQRHGPEQALLVQTLLFRNDWKAGELVRSMLQSPAIEEAFLAPFKSSELLTFEVPAKDLVEIRSEAYPGPVLDTCIYGNRVYFGTLDGLLESYIHPRRTDRHYALNLQLDKRINKLAVGYAAINASAESAGLHFGQIEFSRNSHDPEESVGYRKSSFRQVADVSYSVSHIGRDILNYEEGDAPIYMQARVETDHKDRSRYEDHNVTGYLKRESLIEKAYRSLVVADPSAEDSEVRLLGNSGANIIAAVGDRLQVARIRTDPIKEALVQRNKSFHIDPIWSPRASEVIETYPVNGGFVVETDDGLTLMTRNGSHPLMAGDAATVRTYKSARRHKEAVGVVREDYASVFGYFETRDALF